MSATVKIGTRGSRLALWQAERVAELMRERLPDIKAEIVVVKTTGDAITEKPLYEIRERGIFVKELESALLGGTIDLAVNSLKDMPLDRAAGLKTAAYIDRDFAQDAFISGKYTGLRSVPAGGKIGTGSRRRESQLKNARPDLIAATLRGNVETRIKKAEDYDGIIISAAGPARLGMGDAIRELLPAEIFTPSPGQGMIAVECAEKNTELGDMMKAVNDPDAEARFAVERAFLERTGGGCYLPVGAYCEKTGAGYRLMGYIGDYAGKRVYRDSVLFGICEEKYGKGLAEKLLSAGGKEVLDEIRKQA